MEQGPEHLHAFVMVVSPSKMPAVVWSRGEDELGWLSCHNEVLRRLGGVSAVNRIGKKRRRSLFGPGRGVSSTPPIGGTPGRWGSTWTPLRPGKAPGKAKAKVRLSRLLVGCEGRRRERCRVPSDSVSSGAGTEGSRVGPGCYLAAGWSKKCASPKVVKVRVTLRLSRSHPRRCPVPRRSLRTLGRWSCQNGLRSSRWSCGALQGAPLKRNPRDH